MNNSLVQPLFDGPLDVVGDIHGEIGALFSLMRQLGYNDDGGHEENRRLVFVGDLTDRGPDSPTVVDLVQHLVKTGRAQCVLGNHELNIMLGERKHDNHWFYGEHWSLDGSDEPTPAVLANDEIRDRVVSFFQTLPVVLERNDLRIVHACWDDSAVEIARHADNAIGLYEQYRQQIIDGHDHSDSDSVERGLEHQNNNPVKVLTSGKERRVEIPFEASGKLRYEERVQWWKDYHAQQLCVFGHYSFFKGNFASSGQAVCIDYAVAKRWMERKSPRFNGKFKAKLAALRIPEMTVVFDDGEVERLGNDSV